MRYWLVAALLFICASPVWAAQNTLTWTDNATNEQVYIVERKAEACTGTQLFEVLVNTLPQDTVQFIDTTVTEGVTYCYRVAAANVDGMSGYSNMADRRVPFSTPATPSALIVGP